MNTFLKQLDAIWPGAGEHCSINFQGFMEGGASEGQRAAHEVLVAS